MYATYNHLNPCNINTLEGVGSQYQKIINLYAVIKKFNLKYIHIPIQVGHNYNNDKDWDKKWDIFFNFKKLSNNDEIDIDKLDKYFIVGRTTAETIFNNKNPNILYLYFHTFDIFNNDPEYYFKDIQNDLINAYDDNNNHRKLIYDKTKTSIAIHIRVYNDFDNDNNGYYENFLKEDTSKEIRFYFTADMYEKLIIQLKEKYVNSEIHIFSQEKYFDIKFKKLRDIKDIKLHFDDMDVFDTFNHLCKADVLVMSLSSFGIVTAYYNKNTVIYLPYEYPPILKSWIVYNNDKLL
jgi:hypothetical protein